MTTHRLKHFLERNDGGCWGDDPTGIDDTIVLRSTEQSANGDWRITAPAVRRVSATERRSKTIDLDDIIITKSSGSADHIGKASIADQTVAELEAVYSNFMQRIRVKPEASPKYVWHLLNSSFARFHYNVYATSTSGLGNLNGTIVGNLPFPIPDRTSQRQIADFLDRETARIDLLIEKKQRLVALLGEKAKSVNELFFINAEADGIQPLHRLYRVVTGKTPSRNEENNFSDEEGLPWATPANLGLLAPIETTKERLTAKGSDGQPVVNPGTVLLNGIGASVGKIGIAGTRLSFNQQIHALLAKKRVLADRFLFFQLLTLKEQLVLLANSTTLPILNAERLGRLELRIFDFDVQKHHCASMDALLQRAEIATQKTNASIDRLKEYRSALITAAVTGQIDVSTWGKQGKTERHLEKLEAEASQ